MSAWLCRYACVHMFVYVVMCCVLIGSLSIMDAKAVSMSLLLALRYVSPFLILCLKIRSEVFGTFLNPSVWNRIRASAVWLLSFLVMS